MKPDEEVLRSRIVQHGHAARPAVQAVLIARRIVRRRRAERPLRLVGHRRVPRHHAELRLVPCVHPIGRIGEITKSTQLADRRVQRGRYGRRRAEVQIRRADQSRVRIAALLPPAEEGRITEEAARAALSPPHVGRVDRIVGDRMPKKLQVDADLMAPTSDRATEDDARVGPGVVRQPAEDGLGGSAIGMNDVDAQLTVEREQWLFADNLAAAESVRWTLGRTHSGNRPTARQTYSFLTSPSIAKSSVSQRDVSTLVEQTMTPDVSRSRRLAV